MSGTPVLSTIREGMAGTRIRAIRGILNSTVNSILSAMSMGRDYAEALAQAQTLGYAEAAPTDDVEGDEVVAKTLILAAVMFGRALTPGQVVRRGITTLTREEMQQALDQGKRIKHIASLRLLSQDGTEISRATADNGTIPTRLEARVEPIALPLRDPLARIDGLLNAIVIQNRYASGGDGDWTRSRALSGRPGDAGRPDRDCQSTMKELTILSTFYAGKS